ncbi:hypothetical protein [Nafulsella turpanensis]|uniref:hypothetical protein n=1 Tax=Nafulsella turpanensis TaxID=1265690 RepID=UPI000347AC16|nr:hypothetical protein [Nafulsella turpanensis]
MAFLDDLLKQLFPEPNQNEAVQVKEELKRNERYLQHYKVWKESSYLADLLRAVEVSYHSKKNRKEGMYHMHLFQSAPANGFALSYHPAIGARSFQFLFDYLRDQVLQLDYRLQNTDRHIRDRGTYVQTTEKHYLKPNSPLHQKLNNQRYGNILLEHVLIDQQPSYLKLLVNVYSDHLFTEALSFDDLLSKLFRVS